MTFFEDFVVLHKNLSILGEKIPLTHGNHYFYNHLEKDGHLLRGHSALQFSVFKGY